MFRKREDPLNPPTQPMPTERVTSVLGSGIVWKGSLSGIGGVRIEGAFEGDIAMRGMLVVGETGRVTASTCANVVIVAGRCRATSLQIR
jgi:cytoskeletal protein CcmA (bactofilin family)